MSSARRSGRIKGPRAVYTNDPFETAGLSEDSSPEELPQSSKRRGKRKRRADEDPASDEEFAEPASGDEVEAPVDDDDSESAAAAVEENDDLAVASARKAKSPVPGSMAITACQADNAPDETHNRGIMFSKEHVAKAAHYVFTFGSDGRDLTSAMYLRGRWFRGIDSCFPTRFSLEAPETGSDLGYGPTLGIHRDQIKTERTLGWDWYYDKDTGERLRNRQRIDKMKEIDARRTYLPKLKKGKHTILTGPANRQEPVHLGHHDSFNFSKPWRNHTARRSDRTSGTTVREGWYLNVGHRVQCMAWAPEQDGTTQYLAISGPITDEQKKKYNLSESETSSAFQPSPSYPCALQLWEIRGVKAGSLTNTLDMNFKPRLWLTLCFEWGDLRRFAWCPMGRDLREEDEKSDMKPIGLLAGVWSDGKLRVLDIKIRRESDKAECVKVISPAFEAKPHSCICTSLAWLSPSDIAVGCSNGYVAIWSIAPSSVLEPEPYFFEPIHTTYVMDITSIYPTNPHLLSTSAMDGETKLWSILNPRGETTSTPRMRISSANLSYSPVLFSVASSDENQFGRLSPIRRFFSTNNIVRMPSTVSALAPCSFWHPFLLYGCTGGEVAATNPARKLLYSKEQQWQQLWFTHDWVQGSANDSSGVSRFYDGYQAESPSLARNLAGDPTTIHDEGTHVTALAWNPNRHCSAWASAALGCGLVRIEDLAI